MHKTISDAQKANAWPFVEARALAKHVNHIPPTKGYVLFETGYGPSGLPHIGTFGEVARTSMVRYAFQQLSDIPTKLFAFSDDMDGLRKIPANIPKKEIIVQHLDKPLTEVPDPFGTHESFGAHNNARLKAFLDSFGFDYEFKSSTELYKSGIFDDMLLRVLERYDDVMKVMLPTLGKERQKTYSPFLPICQTTRKVLQVPILERNIDAGTIIYKEANGTKVEIPVTGGHCKLQWKPDWAMRWAALAVDYEMSGKDLIDSVNISGKICRALGAVPPVNLSYELFLDDNGEKISKSKGNGLAVEEWLRYAPPESLSLFMYQKPKTAKRLYFDVIPKAVDEYLSYLEKFPDQGTKEQLENPVWHIHEAQPPHEKAHLSFNILLNLVGVCHTEDKAVLWHFISRYRPGISAENSPILNTLVEYAIRYYQDFVQPTKIYRSATEDEVTALTELRHTLVMMEPNTRPEDIQNAIYSIGKKAAFPDLKSWFRALYEILLGQSHGPRMGSFIALYGIQESITLIDRALAGEDLGS